MINFFSLLLVSLLSFGQTKRVLVIDSGLNLVPERLHLCPSGHRDFTGTGLQDELGHGTNVVSLIAQELPPNGACIIVYKVFTDLPQAKSNNAYLQSLFAATQLKPDFVNLSLRGTSPLLLERLTIAKLLNSGTTIVAAAGNDRKNLTYSCNIFPACLDPRIIIVGAHDVKSSNYGAFIDIYESGFERLGGGVISTGTSQATATTTGKIVARKLRETLRAD